MSLRNVALSGDGDLAWLKETVSTLQTVQLLESCLLSTRTGHSVLTAVCIKKSSRRNIEVLQYLLDEDVMDPRLPDRGGKTAEQALSPTDTVRLKMINEAVKKRQKFLEEKKSELHTMEPLTVQSSNTIQEDSQEGQEIKSPVNQEMETEIKHTMNKVNRDDSAGEDKNVDSEGRDDQENAQNGNFAAHAAVTTEGHGTMQPKPVYKKQTSRDYYELLAKTDDRVTSDATQTPTTAHHSSWQTSTQSADACDSESDVEEPEIMQDDVVSEFTRQHQRIEDLTWEIEWTEEFKQKLETAGDRLRRKVVDKIIKIADDDQLSRKLTKPVSPKYHVFSARVTKAIRLLWQIAPSVSSRSPTDECGQTVHVEKIRLWHLVLDHDKLNRCIGSIEKSIRKGNTCQDKFKNVVAVTQKPTKDRRERRVPGMYVEGKKEGELVSYCSPASSRDQEFTTKKFYHFTNDFINVILSGTAANVDFPFEVTGQEKKIICLPNDAPIMLLGRSGTGKTTCLLYRMWRNFVNFWEKTAGMESEPAAHNGPCSESLHQLFVTKNPVLCDRMKKNFTRLVRGRSTLKHLVDSQSDRRLPPRIQDVDDHSYPLFLTIRQFLVLLDGSLPSSDGQFFARKDDGSLKYERDHYGDHDGRLEYLPTFPDDSDEEDEAEEEKGTGNLGLARHTAGDRSPERERRQNAQRPTASSRRPRVETTYSVFQNELWPKLKKSYPIHAVSVWKEIKSYIKGSLGAILSEDDFLTKEKYSAIGRKRAPDFRGNRDDIFEIFNEYHKLQRMRRGYDECDAVRKVFRRLSNTEDLPWSLDELYVDEVQDFTQAELALLIAACTRPNNAFFTGDTAQSIMRGVGFRFEDLQSLYADPKAKQKLFRSSVTQPEKPYHLTENYRSHAGVLSLAASILDLLKTCFPYSFDHRNLPRDEGRLVGPKPVLIESASATDLAAIARGSKRRTSALEFGAHQVVIVQSEEAKESLPEELKTGLCMTTFETKGLEFDDILLYNFFRDSKASSEDWRAVSGLFEQLLEEGRVKARQMPGDYRPPRPIPFQMEAHRILCSELKYLYTAVTRARANVWMFDDDLIKREPMFDYFRRLDLVACIRKEEEGFVGLHESFATSTSPEEWLKQGKAFEDRNMWQLAAKCYEKAGDEKEHERCLAYDLCARGLRARDDKSDKARKYFLNAAELFCNCGQTSEEAKCRYYAGEYYQAGTLWEPLGKVSRMHANY
jgi:hypothetical protein